ncbi:MAG TPA: discoidin domain-containing protein, partial [Bacilli bacterium]
IVTVSTLDNNTKTEYNTPLPVEGARTVLDTDATGSVQNTTDNILYADDFNYSAKTAPVIGAGGQITGTQSYIDSRGGSKGVIPRYTSDRNGAFEAYLPDGSTNYVLRQQLDQSIMGLGGTWNGGDPITGIGDSRWANYKASVDVSFENNSTQNGTNYAAIGARQQGGSSSHAMSGTPYFLKFWFDGGWSLHVNGSSVASGNVVTGSGGVTISGFNTAYNAWHNIAIQVAGNKVTAYLDGVKLASYHNSYNKVSGRVDLASGYYHTLFDNLRVETVAGHAPYYSELLDNLEMHDLASAPASKLVYSGSWAHANGKSMYTYQRSLSTSQAAGATMQYTFTGTGLDIMGLNDGSAKLEVTVDGVIVNSSAATMSSGDFNQTFTLRGLAYGQHTIQIKVVSGTLAVDAVAVVSSEEPLVNLALNKPVTYSTQESGNFASHLVDGSLSSRWAASSESYPQWVQVDLGKTYSINQTEIYPYNSRAYQYKIEASTDGTNYTTIVDRTSNTTGGSLFTDTFTATNARYVKITITGVYNCSGCWAGMYEIGVYQDSNSEPDTQAPTAPTNLTATTASSSQINLSWTASTDNVGVTGYKIYRDGVEVGTSTTTSFSNTGLAAGTTYSYTVKAYDAANNLSASSNTASATTTAASTTMHVQDIAMALASGSGKTWAKATILITDGSGNPVANATVSGQWSGKTTDSDSAVTGSDGKVTVESNKLSNNQSSGTYTFTVNNVTHSTLTYKSSENVMTSNSITK